MDERDVVVIAEQADDLLGLVGAHEAVIDENACQLLADRLVDEDSGDGAVDAAGQSADNAAGADLSLDLGDLRGAKFGHRPVAAKAADMADEVGEEFGAIGRVQDFRVKLDAVEASLVMHGGGKGRSGGLRDDAEALRQTLDPVAMAHPDLVALAWRP
jgi:hypothetical protein